MKLSWLVRALIECGEIYMIKKKKDNKRSCHHFCLVNGVRYSQNIHSTAVCDSIRVHDYVSWGLVENALHLERTPLGKEGPRFLS